MNDSAPSSDLDFRLGLLERETAEHMRRIGELERALAIATGVNPLPAGPAEITLDADSISPFAAGFYYAQTDGSNRTYRWTGRGDFFEFRFALDRNTPWSFSMELLGNEHVSLSSLRAFVDYAEIPITFKSESRYVCGTIPARIFSSLIVMTFYLPTKFIPSKLDPSSLDHRTLSAVFYQLKLVPWPDDSEGSASGNGAAGDQ